MHCLLFIKVSVQGVVGLGGHFKTLFKKLGFYEDFFFITNFQIILIVKSLQLDLLGERHTIGSLTQLDPYTVRSLDLLTQLDPYTVRSLHIQIPTHSDP